MEQNTQVRETLVSQLENEYGRLVYTYTCHLKQAKVIFTPYIEEELLEQQLEYIEKQDTI